MFWILLTNSACRLRLGRRTWENIRVFSRPNICNLSTRPLTWPLSWESLCQTAIRAFSANYAGLSNNELRLLVGLNRSGRTVCAALISPQTEFMVPTHATGQGVHSHQGPCIGPFSRDQQGKNGFVSLMFCKKSSETTIRWLILRP